MNGAFPPDMLSYGAGLLGIAGAFHLVLRWRASYADPLLLPIATLLNGLGLVMIHRLDLAYGRTGMDALALKQLVWSALSVVDRRRGHHHAARPPAAAALHLHRDGRRPGAAAAAAGARHRPQRAGLPDLDRPRAVHLPAR